MEKYDLIMNRNELSLLGGLVDLLDVFNIFTTFIQGNDYPTLNTFALFYAEINDRLTKMHALYEDEDDVIAKAAEILLKNLDRRLPLNEECVAAALVDPRMQHLPIIGNWLVTEGKRFSCFSFLINIFL